MNGILKPVDLAFGYLYVVVMSVFSAGTGVLSRDLVRAQSTVDPNATLKW